MTNGIGGFASGTVAQANTRRYHGLLVASLKPPVDSGRDGRQGGCHASAIAASSSNWAATNLPTARSRLEAFEHSSGFRLERSDPDLDLRLLGCGARTAHLDGAGPQHDLLELHAARGQRGASTSNWTRCAPIAIITATRTAVGRCEVQAEARGCRVTAFPGARPYRLLLDAGEFVASPDWYWHFRHRAEGERGLDETEDLFHPGDVSSSARAGRDHHIHCSQPETEEPESAATRRRAGLKRTAVIAAGNSGSMRLSGSGDSRSQPISSSSAVQLGADGRAH